MRKKASPEDLSIDELRRLLVEKRHASRQNRLEHFRRTGRLVVVAPDIESSTLQDFHSEPHEEEELLVENALPSRRKRLFDGFLLAVEIIAVVGLFLVLFNGVNIIRELNQEVVSAIEQPTLTPTPLIVAVVLPSGHTPPNSPGGAQPNYEEIPEHLQPLAQSLANIPTPTPGPEQTIRLQIPAINVDAPVVQGDGSEQLKKGIGQHIGSSNPGQQGNVVLSAHNDIFGEIFRELDRLTNGDPVILYTHQHTYTYVVTSNDIVEPTQVEVMDSSSSPTVTLISCYPYMVDNKRIVVTARLQSEN